MKHKPIPATHMEKELGWACKLGGVECLVISKVGQTASQLDGASDMAPACLLGLEECGFFNSVVVKLPSRQL